MYKIRSMQLYNDVAKHAGLGNSFYFWNLPHTHTLYNTENKHVTKNFKDEFASEIRKEFMGLKFKFYSTVAADKLAFAIILKKNLKN